MKVKELTNAKSCKNKAFFTKLGFDTQKGENYDMSVAVKKVINDCLSTGNRADIQTLLSDELKNSRFMMSTTKESLILNASQFISRFLRWMDENASILKVRPKETLNLGGINIEVRADYLIATESNVYCMNIHQSAPKLSKGGRSAKTNPVGDLGIYLLAKLAEKVVSDPSIKGVWKPEKINGAYFHLKNRDDSGADISAIASSVFEPKPGKNIVSASLEKLEDNSFGVDFLAEIKESADIVDNISLNDIEAQDSANCDNCPFTNVCHFKEIEVSDVQEIKNPDKADKGISMTKEQLEAVNFRTGIARINAGAGSGKTTVLAIRVAELLTDGVKPEEILMITFTNKGAQEMRSKVKYWIDELDPWSTVDVDKITIETFNSWGEKLIGKHHTFLGFSEPPSLADKVERYDLLMSVIDNHDPVNEFHYKNPLMNFPHSKGVLIEMSQLFDEYKSEYITSSDDLINLGHGSEAVKLFEMYKEYNILLKTRNKMEYQDQINYIIRLFDEKPQIIEDLGYAHIMVDEFQDTDFVQFDLISNVMTSSKFKSLMVIGDDAQSIFGFRNVGPERLLEFHKYFSEVKDIYLTDNFRSAPEILEVANALNLKYRKTSVSKMLKSNLPNGKVWYHDEEKETSISEAEMVATQILEDLKNGNKPESIAYIARTRAELVAVAEILKLNKVPFVFDTQDLLLEHSAFKALISLAKFIDNEIYDFHLFEYLFAVKKDDFKTMNVEEIKSYIEEKKISFLEKMSLATSEKERIDFFFKICKSLVSKDSAIEAFLETVESKKLKTLASIVNYLLKVELFEDALSVERDGDKTFGAITLTTVHGSKGKEWPIVHHSLGKYKINKTRVVPESEELRVMFVAITRAKQALRLYYKKQQKIDEGMLFI